MQRAVAKIKIEKALSTNKREDIKPYVNFTHRQPPFAKSTKRTRTVESGKKMAAFPRSQTTGYSDICVLACDGIGRAIIRICSDFGTSI